MLNELKINNKGVWMTSFDIAVMAIVYFEHISPQS